MKAPQNDALYDLMAAQRDTLYAQIEKLEMAMAVYSGTTTPEAAREATRKPARKPARRSEKAARPIRHRRGYKMARVPILAQVLQNHTTPMTRDALLDAVQGFYRIGSAERRRFAAAIGASIRRGHLAELPSGLVYRTDKPIGRTLNNQPPRRD